MLDNWVTEIIADPITKLHATPEQIGMTGSVIDARRYLKNTVGYNAWSEGQQVYEAWEADTRRYETFVREIEYDRPVYDHIKMSGRILDVGGGAGTVREFLPPSAEFVSIDPFIDWQQRLDPEKIRAYNCLKHPLNFIAACAEFLPFEARSFDWVHMRSMLDHVQSADLALIEAKRVLKTSGRLVIGLYVDGGKSGVRTLDRQLKEIVRTVLTAIGINRYKDHHIFHPTFANLSKIVLDNGFEIEDVYWQPQWKDTVCYIIARPV